VSPPAPTCRSAGRINQNNIPPSSRPRANHRPRPGAGLGASLQAKCPWGPGTSRAPGEAGSGWSLAPRSSALAGLCRLMARPRIADRPDGAQLVPTHRPEVTNSRRRSPCQASSRWFALEMERKRMHLFMHARFGGNIGCLGHPLGRWQCPRTLPADGEGLSSPCDHRFRGRPAKRGDMSGA
jgi:hypothetical protein